MNNHYYNKNPIVEHDERIINAVFFGKEFRFKTDSGVFSKNKVDYGSSLLIKSFIGTENAKVLDMGCGYGPIGITISSKLISGEVKLADINQRAVNLVKENIRINEYLINKNVKLTTFQSDGFDKTIGEGYDYIIINPPIRAGKLVVFKLYEEAYKHLNDNGELWIVIQKKQGAPSSIVKLKELYSEVEIIKGSKGYFVIRSNK